MEHGSPKSAQFIGRRLLAAVAGVLVFLTVNAASGPADDVGIEPDYQPDSPIAAPVTIKLENSPMILGMALIPSTPDDSTDAELLHDAAPPPAASTISISPDAIVPRAKLRTLWVEVTAYCPCKKCCGSNAKGVTSSGKPITYNDGHFLAADLKIFPYGTRLIVPGYNNEIPVQVIDRGGAIRGYHIDIFMQTHEQAVQWGKKRLQVTVVE